MLQNGKAIAPLALLQAPSWPPATEGGFLVTFILQDPNGRPVSVDL